MNLEDLKLEQTRLAADLKAVNDKIHDIELSKAIEESPFKIGDKVLMYKNPYEITHTRLSWKGADHYGKKILKSGELGKQVFALYGVLSKLND